MMLEIEIVFTSATSLSTPTTPPCLRSRLTSATFPCPPCLRSRLTSATFPWSVSSWCVLMTNPFSWAEEDMGLSIELLFAKNRLPWKLWRELVSRKRLVYYMKSWCLRGVDPHTLSNFLGTVWPTAGCCCAWSLWKADLYGMHFAKTMNSSGTIGELTQLLVCTSIYWGNSQISMAPVWGLQRLCRVKSDLTRFTSCLTCFQ